MQKIFSTKSPIEPEGLGLDPPKKPLFAPSKKELTNLSERVSPLLHIRKAMDKVYADGYFERHYSEADKKLKNLLHRKAMTAWAHAEHFGSQHEEPCKEEEPKQAAPVNIVIKLGG